MSLLAVVEAFHIAFLRAFASSVSADHFAIKGGCNLRFFFGSERYSEDLDVDIHQEPVHQLQEKVMSILESGGLNTTARTYGIDRVRRPNLSKAKQTETVQRFKIHLETTSGEDLPTKIEFSRRGMDQPIRVEAIRPEVLAPYRTPSLIVPHYAADAAVRQKIHALIGRRVPQARDIFDLHVLSAQPELVELDLRTTFSPRELETALTNTYSVEYDEFRDTVLSFLSPESQKRYGSKEVWDQVRLTAVSLIELSLQQ
ncbi:MAG TPA: nucleotidyl transferase AbiEii/AbiGii toxin family protein [Vicinamibacteria bacterium]|nr:nucleotidyl transferase AbiEii/AbiGii toxin family protein [Vicinamibacteria bacterium]